MSVDLVGPDGKEYVLDNEDPKALDEVLRQGFKRPVAPEEKSALEQVGETAAAGTLGAVRGLTGGLSDAVTALAARPDRSGFVDPAALSGRKEAQRLEKENPTASTVGELGGALVSPINEVGALMEGPKAATAAGRIGQKMLGGAAVGSLYGAGSAVSDAALGDPDLTADKVLAHIGLGALLGAAGGGVGTAVEEGVSGLFPKLAKSAPKAQAALEDFANDRTIAATKANQALVNKMGEVRTTAAAQALRDEGLLGARPKDMLPNVEKRIGEVGAEKGSILDVAEAGGATPSHSELLQRLDQFEADQNPLQRKAIAKDLAELRESIAEIGSRPANATGPQGSGFRALDDLRQSVAKRAKFSKGPAGVDDELLGLKRQLSGVMRDEVDRQLVPQLGADIGKHYADTKALYGSLKDAATLLNKGASYSKSSGVFGLGLYDLLAGIGGGAIHPLGLAAAIGSKFMREYGPGVVAKLADKMAESPVLSTMAKSFAAQMPATAPKLGAYAPALLNAVAQSPEVALATHMTMAHVDPSYAATAQMAGLTPEQPDEHLASLAKAHRIAETGAAAAETDKAVERHLERIIKGTGKPAAPGAMDRQDFGNKRMRRDVEASHEQRVKEYRELAGNPDALLERVAGNLGGVSPAIAAALSARAQTAVQYLAQAAAVPPKGGPLAHEWTPTEAEMHDFAQKLEVVERPQSILEHMAWGGCTEQMMDALKAAHSGLAKDWGDKALMMLADAPERVPYSARFMVSMLCGIDPDGTFSPEAIQANQTAIQAAGAREAAKGVPGSPKKADSISLAARTATPSEKRELAQE